MKLIAVTQYHENYAFDADGSPSVPGYWKAKGGTEYVVARNLKSIEDTAELQALLSPNLTQMVQLPRSEPRSRTSSTRQYPNPPHTTVRIDTI